MVEKKYYDHRACEAKWQERWSANKQHETPDAVEGKENEYLLVEYPYPSGNLHIGHWYAFAVPDIFARFRRMQGKNVLFPIGFDSFGLPAENAAIKHGLDPKKWTYDNIAHMEGQLKSMGNSFDWSRKVVASDPEYYQWTQWLFLQFFKKGLAYKKKASVPWCDSCKTVLANEQIVNGACERCSTPVVQKELSQWYLKITDYAERLLADLDALDWPEEIKQAQREWIGKSEGALLKFKVQSAKSKIADEHNAIEVFTTRADTLYGATYLVLAPEHPLLRQDYEGQALWQYIENKDEVSAYIERTKQKKELERKEGKEKTGVVLKGVKAINPATKEEIPIWIADYVLGSYGTGAIMAVPAHDERDWEFAEMFNLEKKCVIKPYGLVTWRDSKDESKNIVDFDAAPEVDRQKILDGLVCHARQGELINSGPFSGAHSEDAKQKITEHVGGTLTTQYRLRDWLLSRQRYWGCPMPIVYDPEGNPHAVPDEHLPWTLPEDVDFRPTGEAPLAKSAELRERTERIFGKGWTPEVDTMDTFVDSSWYFLRYLDPHNTQAFSSREKQQAWMPVARYSGGAEHTTMHVLYSRFFHKALYDFGLVTTSEPYKVRMNRGLILGPDGAKMSKSKGNVINPDEHVERVGADTVKMYLAFIGPYNEPGQYPWDMGGIAGVRRFLERVWNLQAKVEGIEKKVESLDMMQDVSSEPTPYNLSPTTSLLLHQAIKKVGEDIAAFKFNTAISAMMILVNHLEKCDAISPFVYASLIRILSPFAPHITEELWEGLGHSTSVHSEVWPTYSPEVLASASVTIAVMVDGKTRGTFTIEQDSEGEALLARAKALVADRLTERHIVREVVVPNRMVSIVTESRASIPGEKLDAS